jgi:hypothetical protein
MKRGARDAGSVTTEVVLVTPVAIVLLCLVAFVGRVTTASEQVNEAARDASRTASLERSAAGAAVAAARAATQSLSSGGLQCADASSTVDTARFAPGGSVTVTVRCTVALDDLALLGVPGSKTLTASSTAVVDTYRSEG